MPSTRSSDAAVAPAPRRRPAPVPLASGWRLPIAASATVAAAAHVPVTAEHLREALYVGVLFVLLEVACVVLAAVLLRAPSRAVAAGSVLLGALAIAAFVVTRAAPMPLIGDDVGRWTEPLAVVSVVAEAFMVVGGLLALQDPRRAPRRPRTAGTAAGAVLAVGALAIGLAVLPGGASAQDEHGQGVETGEPGHDMPGMDMSDMDGPGAIERTG